MVLCGGCVNGSCDICVHVRVWVCVFARQPETRNIEVFGEMLACVVLVPPEIIHAQAPVRLPPKWSLGKLKILELTFEMHFGKVQQPDLCPFDK